MGGQSVVEGAQAATRVLELVIQVGAHSDGARLTELAAEVGLSEPTTHRLLRAMVATGFAVQDPVTKRYMLGPRIAALAGQMIGGERLKVVARPVLERLQAETGETVFLAALDRDEVVIVDCIVTEATLRLGGRPGVRLPIHASSQGKAILAFRDEPDRERVLSRLQLRRLTRNTIQTAADLRVDLERVRAQGYAVNDQEREPGVRSVAAPICDASGRAYGAVCVGAPATRWRMDRMVARFVPAAVVAAREISRRAQAEGIES
jgi:DNA-binding IclR family transcriptional regulator